jgi:hypothetical protein
MAKTQRWARYSYESTRRLSNPRTFLHAQSRSLLLYLAGLRSRPTLPLLRCLHLHGVFDDQIDSFREICIMLQQRGRFVDSDDCIRIIKGEIPVSAPLFHLSFDDGFRNLLTNALPVLQELSIPATVFVPTGLIGADYETIASYCLDIIRYAAPVEVLSWDDLAELSRRGVTVSSHTHTHARLSSLVTRDQLYSEIAQSKILLEQKLGTECRYISWPFGMLADMSQQAFAMVRECGYAGCFAGYRGSIKPGHTNQFCIPRHHFEPNWPLSHVKLFASGYREQPDVPNDESTADSRKGKGAFWDRRRRSIRQTSRTSIL